MTFEAATTRPRRSVLLRRRAWLSGATTAGLELVRWGLAASLQSCAGDLGSARRVTIETWSAPASNRFDNALGFSVSLTSAWLGLEHVYFVTGDPVGGSVSLRSVLGVPHARAHPGHYAAGDVLAEMNNAVDLDVLAPPRRLSESDGVTGSARSCVLRFRSLKDEQTAVRVAGEATVDGRRWRFEAGATLDELLHSHSELPEVPGIVVEDGEISNDGRMRLSIDPAVWLDQIDFERLEASDPAHVVRFTPGSQPHNAFVRGIRKAVAYHAAFDEFT